MAQVTVTVNGRKYDIACDDGQEAHLMRLGQYVDKRIGELVAAVGQIGDARLLVMASLLITDELTDAYASVEQARAAGDGIARRMAVEDSLGASLESLAGRIEDIADRLERP